MESFKKSERLCSKFLIDKLIANGKSLKNFPFKIIWLEVKENIAPLQILISVPKRNFKKAVDRNYLKRIIREGYRRNKNKLILTLENKKIIIMIVFVSKKKIDYSETESKIISLLQDLAVEIKSSNLENHN